MTSFSGRMICNDVPLLFTDSHPAGSLQITAAEHAAETVLLTGVARFLPAYPRIHLELTLDYGLTDIVAAHVDAGIRLGERCEGCDCSPRGSRFPDGVRGDTHLPRREAGPEGAAGPARPQLHQSQVANTWRHLPMAIPECKKKVNADV